MTHFQKRPKSPFQENAIFNIQLQTLRQHWENKGLGRRISASGLSKIPCSTLPAAGMPPGVSSGTPGHFRWTVTSGCNAASLSFLGITLGSSPRPKQSPLKGCQRKQLSPEGQEMLLVPPFRGACSAALWLPSLSGGVRGVGGNGGGGKGGSGGEAGEEARLEAWGTNCD